jgi:DNA-binding transcriptional ArsR family regulator
MYRKLDIGQREKDEGDFFALHIPEWEYDVLMARLLSTADVFSAIAESRRREILELLRKGGELAVGALVGSLGIPQPAVSKHLGVLRKVGLVAVTKQGKQRMYKLEAQRLKIVHDWTKTFEVMWENQLDRIKERAEQKARQSANR